MKMLVGSASEREVVSATLHRQRLDQVNPNRVATPFGRKPFLTGICKPRKGFGELRSYLLCPKCASAAQRYAEATKQ